jgi:hypothetical protein
MRSTIRTWRPSEAAYTAAVSPAGHGSEDNEVVVLALWLAMQSGPAGEFAQPRRRGHVVLDRRGSDLSRVRLDVRWRAVARLAVGEQGDRQRSLCDRPVAQQPPNGIVVEVDPAMRNAVSLQQLTGGLRGSEGPPADQRYGR